MPKKKSGGKKKAKSKKSKGASVDTLKPPVKSPEVILFESFKVMHWWLNEECSKVDAYFASNEKTPAGQTLTTDEFILGLKYLQVPISSHQIELLIKYLENGTSGLVDLLKFKGLNKLSDQELLNICHTTSLVNEETNDITLEGEKKKGKQVVKQVMIDSEYHMETEARFVELNLSLATFKDYKKHPGHFTVCLTTDTTVHGVSELIQQHFKNGMTMKSIRLFTKPSCSKDSCLSPSQTLESCGIRGSLMQHDPSTHQLYYDYIPDFIDCPLLMTNISMRL